MFNFRDREMSDPEIFPLSPGTTTVTSPNTLLNEIASGLAKKPHHRSLPTTILYDEIGLKLYDKITTDVPEYYLFAAEESILKEKADEIVKAMCGPRRVDGEVVLELGAGSLRKTSFLLLALAGLTTKKSKPITYFALDLEPHELVRTLKPFTSRSDLGLQLAGKVTVKGLCGTYDEGIKFVRDGRLACLTQDNKGRNTVPNLKGTITPFQSPDTSLAPLSCRGSPAIGTVPSIISSSPQSKPVESRRGLNDPPLHFLFLGSSIGNFSREGAVEFLLSLPLRPSVPEHPPDTLLLGLDHKNPRSLIELAYNDPKGITRDFVMNGLAGISRMIGREVFRNEAWEYVSKYNEAEGHHAAYYRSMIDQEISVPIDGKTQTTQFAKGELINLAYSHKYSDADAQTLFRLSNLVVVQRWVSKNGLYSLWLLRRPESNQGGRDCQ